MVEGFWSALSLSQTSLLSFSWACFKDAGHSCQTPLHSVAKMLSSFHAPPLSVLPNNASEVKLPQMFWPLVCALARFSFPSCGSKARSDWLVGYTVSISTIGACKSWVIPLKCTGAPKVHADVFSWAVGRVNVSVVGLYSNISCSCFSPSNYESVYITFYLPFFPSYLSLCTLLFYPSIHLHHIFFMSLYFIH